LPQDTLFQVLTPSERIEHVASGQVYGNGIDGEVPAAEIDFYRQGVVKSDDKVTMSYPGRDFSPRQGNVDRWIMPPMRQKFNDAKGASCQLDAPILPQEADEVGLRHTRD
jgi:hypothetical protein